jgi:hypothetical protein
VGAVWARATVVDSRSKRMNFFMPMNVHPFPCYWA